MLPTSSFANASPFPFPRNPHSGTFDFVCRPLGSAEPPTRSLAMSNVNEQKRFRTACKARGVAGDHNPNTAYLLVPENAPHGYILNCSHALCVKTGRQFRYCAYCCQPVAKRNFHARHNHGLIRYEDGRPIIPADEIYSDNGKFQLLRQEAGVSDEGRPLKRARSVSAGSASVDQQVSNKKTKHQASDETRQREDRPKLIEVSDHDSVKSDLPCSQESTLSTQEEAWVKLFHERPRSAMQGDAGLKKWVASMLKLTFPKQNFESAVLSFQPQESIEDLDDVLGDFDKDLKDFEGDWDLETL